MNKSKIRQKRKKQQKIDKIQILGINIANCTIDELNEYICELINAREKEAVLNVNINCMNLAHNNPWLKEFLNSVNLVFCDSDGVRLGARLLGLRIKEKITYNRWVWDLARLSETNSFTWYLIGAEEPVIRKATDVLREVLPNLQILGFHSGYFSGQSEINSVISDINSLKPNILILGMGMPLQEKWLMEHLSRLCINIALTGGAVFDYISGNAKMTPDFFYKHKLEWLYRFMCEPNRLFKRYFFGNPLFFLRLFMNNLKRSVKNTTN